ncbi:MAG: phosphoribosylformylglycinamidine synthase subunit PurQ [Alphaproteobacteria bacterium]|nr:phosphoribosylformylglycinamidine synthase subunit PurQ [Alphaproteobacteria bacterium]
MSQPVFLILSGDGINCERETAAALAAAGAKAEIVHINDLAARPDSLARFDGMAIPGGFSFGDELGSGQILALKIRHKLGKRFFDFVAARKPVIGICNGFQVLVKLGLLPYPETQKRVMALAPNTQGGFIDRWVTLQPAQNSVCKWTEGMETFDLPIRHGEGRVVFSEDAIYHELRDNGQIALAYAEDVNGSHKRIAGLCDPSGLIFGLMPHPEAFAHQATHRTPQRAFMAAGAGLRIFKNIVYYLAENQKEKIYAGRQH